MSYRALNEDSCRVFFGKRIVGGTVAEVEVAEPLVLACWVPCRLKSNETAKARFFKPRVPVQPIQLTGSPATPRIIPSAFPRKVTTLPLTVCVNAPSCTPNPKSSGVLGRETRSVVPLLLAVEPICLSTRARSQVLTAWSKSTSPYANVTNRDGSCNTSSRCPTAVCRAKLAAASALAASKSFWYAVSLSPIVWGRAVTAPNRKHNSTPAIRCIYPPRFPVVLRDSESENRISGDRIAWIVRILV